MGLIDQIKDVFDGDNRERVKKFSKARTLASTDVKAGVEDMLKLAKTEAEFKTTAAVHWREVKRQKGESAAFEDPEYKRIMALAYRAEY